MRQPQKLSILIVDADLLAREGVKRILSNEYRNIQFGEAGTAEEALIRIKAQPWRLVVLHASLPDKDGFSVLREIRAHRPESAVLVLSMDADTKHAARSLQLGAAGYSSKNCGRADLLKAFRSVLDGKKHFSKSIRAAGDPSPAPDVNLSAQESRGFRALASGKRTGEIAAELNLSAKTVSTYKLRIMNKLNVKSIADLVRYQIDHRLF